MTPFDRGVGTLVVIVAAFPGALEAQRAIIAGRVVVKGSDATVGYAVVATSPGREQFAGSDGRFTIRDLPAGHVAISAKRIGYAPFDTVVNVAAGDSLNLRLELSLVTIQLPAVHSLARACAHPGESNVQIGAELAVLFEQVKQNADRNRLLARSYPFEIEVERKVTKPEPALEARFIAFDTVRFASDRAWRYAPGKMLGTREYTGGAFGGTWVTLTMPELADFADEGFLTNHCFDFGGTDVVDGDTLLRVDFVPAPVVHDPDVAGSIFLDPTTYQLRLTLLSLVNLTKKMREQTSGQSVRVDFKEVIPGVAVFDRASSVVLPREDPRAPPQEPATETQRTLRVHFLRGRP